jgi:tetratricopeptide (TPR) repeat protein
MAIDKGKIEKNALNLIRKRAYRKAIEEYKKIVDADPRDVRSRVKLMELYVREKMVEEAIAECQRISTAYVDQGFVVRAIAVWKQALRLDPNNPDLYRNMGELYLKQKLQGDALAAFGKAVILLRKGDRGGEAGDLLKRMEELAPDNPTVKMMLAEHYLLSGRVDDFQSLFEKVRDQLTGEGRGQKLLLTLEALYEKSGGSSNLFRPLASLCLNLGEGAKAIRYIRAGLKEQPGDRELRLLLVRANISQNRFDEARRMALEMRDVSPNDIPVIEQLAVLAEAQGNEAEQGRWYAELASLCQSLGQTAKADFYTQKAKQFGGAEAPRQKSSGGFGAEVDSAFDALLSGGGEEAPAETPSIAPAELAEGLMEADLYMKYGLEDRAQQKLDELARLAPDTIEVHQKLRDLCWRRGDRVLWAREQMEIARLFREQGRAQEAGGAYQAILDADPENSAARAALEELRGPAAGAEPEATDRVFQGELEQADALAANGKIGEAVELLLRLRELYSSSAAVTRRLDKMGWRDVEQMAAGAAAPGEEEVRPESLGDLDFDLASSIAGFEEVEVSELDDIVKEFKSSVAEKLGEEDFETHYDLGVAYKEMGLLEEALHQFQKAARFTEKAKNAYASMALIYHETGQVSDARSALKMALMVPSNTPEDRASILYELGALAEEQGLMKEALSAFEQAAAIDSAHRDVAERLQKIRARAGV